MSGVEGFEGGYFYEREAGIGLEVRRQKSDCRGENRTLQRDCRAKSFHFRNLTSYF